MAQIHLTQDRKISRIVLDTTLITLPSPGQPPSQVNKLLLWWDNCQELACPAIAIRACTLKPPRQIAAARA